MHAEMRRLILIATLAACSDKSAPPVPTPPVPVSAADAGVDPAEVAAARARIDASATRECPRPVVRPPALAGRALADQVAFLECRAAGTDCTEALHQAVSHSDACSPYQVSRKLDDLAPLAQFTASDPWTLVEYVAFLQDVARGAVPTAVSLAADDAMGAILDQLITLAQTQKLPAELGTALASLQAAMPHVADSLQAQRDQDLAAGIASPAVTCAPTLAACHAAAKQLDRTAPPSGGASPRARATLVERRARSVSQLATLQVLVAAQRMSTCPLPPQLASAPLYKTLLSPPLLGAPVRIAGTPPRLAPPAFVTPLVEWNIVCP